MDALKVIFATQGLPESFVIDNGPQITSAEFQNFLENNGICRLHSASYHSAMNGLAECAVQIFQCNMEKNTEGSITT